MKVSPYLLGSGKAATAILEALKIIEINHPEMKLSSIEKLKRGDAFPDVKGLDFPMILIANPHALHAQAIIDAEKAGFKLIVVEKPVAVSLDQVHALRRVEIPVAVCHGYRQTWGLQTLKQMIQKGELGELITIEGRYWQSSSALKALSNTRANSWKNDPHLSGEGDTLLDLATHWADACRFLMGQDLTDINVWRSFVNAEAPHRDTHIHLHLDFSQGKKGLGSISKTVHGAGNQFEINVIGSKKFASWKFLEPDVIELGEGSERKFISRQSTDMGSGHWPFHGLGWLEGYVEIILQGLKGGSYPTLKESLDLMEFLLKK